MKTVSTWALALALALGTFACSAEAPSVTEDPSSEEALARGSNSDRWVYNGVLPHLVDPAIVVAQTPHTVRVTGYLPSGFDAKTLPFYVSSVTEGERVKISVVYPIATGSSVNHQPDDYVVERVYPRRTDSSAPWGGFPFMSYVNDDSPYKGIAFHGPITSEDGEWKLVRGPVSHGCNRMQGEHVVELASLIGVDMTSRVWSGDTIFRNYKVPVKVLRGENDTWLGKSVDVDYPAQAGVKRPTTNTMMFKTWRSQDFPAWVCKIDDRKGIDLAAVPGDYCARVRSLRNTADAAIGPR